MQNPIVKQILIWGGVLAATILGVIVIINASNSLPGSSTSSSQQKADPPPPVASTDLTQGPKNAPVTLIEYADFQCPACGAYYPLVTKLLSDEKGKIYYVYRYFPLTQVHKNAMMAAQASYAANLQGKFWPMYDKLYTNQKDWSDLDNPQDTFVGYAKDLGLDTTKFKSDMTAQSTANYIKKQIDAGDKINITHTPTFFLNGQEIQPQSYDEFKADIENAAKK